MKNKKLKKSSPVKKSEQKSTNTSSVRKYVSCGFHITLRQCMVAQRSATFDVSEEELKKIPEYAVISKEPKPPAKFEMKEPASIVAPGEEEKNVEEWEKYRRAKERFETKHVDDKPMITVNALVPVKVNIQVLIDGQEVKIFHTLRGPVMGIVENEDLNRAYLYSPCFIDPNIERGRIHYLPIAFAGFAFTLYKSGGMGESVPQEAEFEGYPHFVVQNQKGDYTFRMKAAYHHIDADYPGDAKLISADGQPRDALMGLIATSDTREQKLIAQAQQAQAAQAAQKQSDSD